MLSINRPIILDVTQHGRWADRGDLGRLGHVCGRDFKSEQVGGTVAGCNSVARSLGVCVHKILHHLLNCGHYSDSALLTVCRCEAS